MGRTLSIIKPDGVERNIIGKILTKYEVAGFKIINISMITLSHEMAERHYFEHKDKSFYGELIKYITSGPSVIVELEAEGAVPKLRAANDEIRELWGVSTTKNTVHGSDSDVSAMREIELFFGNRA